VLKNNGRKLVIHDKREWYQVEPQQAANVQSIFIGSDVSDSFVLGEDGINFDNFHMKYYSHLKELSIAKPISADELSLIQKLPLKKLSVSMREAPLKIAMPKLRELTFFITGEAGVTPIEGLAIKSDSQEKIDFDDCPLLEELYISHLRSFDLHCLAALSSLRRLRINDCVLSDLSPLSDLPLTDVILSCCHLADVSPLDEIATLQTISLYGNDIEKAAQLCSLPELRQLELRNNPLKDAEEIRKRFHGETLIINRHDAAIERINRQVKDIRYWANRWLFNQSVALMKKEPSNLAEKMRYKHLTEQDYDCALEDQIVVLAKDAVKNFDENAYCNEDAFDYKAYFLSRIRRE